MQAAGCTCLERQQQQACLYTHQAAAELCAPAVRSAEQGLHLAQAVDEHELAQAHELRQVALLTPARRVQGVCEVQAAWRNQACCQLCLLGVRQGQRGLPASLLQRSTVVSLGQELLCNSH